MKGAGLGAHGSQRVTGAFPEGWGRIPDNPLVAASIAALLRGGPGAQRLAGGWTAAKGARLTSRWTGAGGLRIGVGFDPAAARAVAGSAGPDAQWACVEGLSPFTIDVLLAILAEICAPVSGNGPAPSLPAPVAIGARAILGHKRMRRWGADAAALRRRVDREIERLSALQLEIGHVAPASLGGLIETLERSAGGRAGSETLWTVRLGPWAHWWLDRDGGFPLTAIPQLVLELDHRRNRGSAVLAKKIALAGMLLCSGDRARTEWCIADLLALIGALPQPRCRTSQWGARMRDRFDRALRILVATGLFDGVAQIPVATPVGRVAGGARAWLGGRVVLSRRDAAAAPEIGTLLRPRGQQPGPAGGSRPIELRRGRAIRAMRLQRDISQRQLADALGVSAAYLSQIENQRRLASPAVLARLAGWARMADGADRHDQNGSIALAVTDAGATTTSTAGSDRQRAGQGDTQIPVTDPVAGEEDSR